MVSCAGNAEISAVLAANSYSAASAVARVQLRAVVEVTKGCGAVSINLDTYAKALADAGNMAFQAINAKQYSSVEVRSSQYNKAYASIISRQELYKEFAVALLGCCGELHQY